MTPSLDVILQNKYLQPGMLDGTPATNHAIALSGWMVGVPSTITRSAFFALTAADVIAALERANPIPDLQTSDIVLIDMEPSWGRPQMWWQQPLEFFAQLRMICETVRSLLPRSRLSLWGLFPPPIGRVTAGDWIRQQGEGYSIARRLGVYETLSSLCVVMRSPHVPGDPGYGRTVQWLQTGLDVAGQFGMPLLACLAFVCINGSSSGYLQQYPAETLQLQLATIINDGRCASSVIWAGEVADVNISALRALGGIFQ